MPTALHELAHAAVSAALASLFARPERFYYCTLVLTEEGLGPTLSAWSVEALERAVQANPGAAGLAADLKWSYADSPYLDHGVAEIAAIRRAFAARPTLRDLGLERWQAEIALRVEVLEAAMRRLDQDGVFARNQSRGEILVAVEFMPPAADSVLIVKRLNPRQSPIVETWLREAAEAE